MSPSTYELVFKQLPPNIQSYVSSDIDLQKHIKKHKLDTEEIIFLVEEEMWLRISIPDQKKEEEKLILAAKNTLKSLQKKQQLTIRIAQQDILKIKTKALEQWIPYQTLIGSIVHGYVQGK